MANEEHLQILLQGVEVWNRWRKENPEIKPDLFGAELGNTNLSNANLSGANLSNANISGADLREATLRMADLRGAALRRANIGNANLSGADLVGAYLVGAYLSGAYLIGANLIGVNLSYTNLSRTNLSRANLSNANLNNVNLSGADLRGADLRESDLSRANLTLAHLLTAGLINTNLDGATLTGARLWETQRAGWSIKGVICEYAYWDKDAKEKTIYDLGEFERLFADQTKIRLFYEGGITPLEIATLPALIQHLSIAYPECNLRFVSIYEDSGGAVVELVIEDDNAHTQEELKQLQAALESAGKEIVEYQRLALAEKESRLRLEGRFEQLNTDFDKLIQRPNITVKNKGDFQMGNTYKNEGGQIGAFGENAHAHDITMNQTVNNKIGESLDLVALAKELATLRIEIAKLQDSSPQAAIAIGEVAKAEIAAGEKDESKVLAHLKAGGKYLLDVATKIGTTVAAKVIEKSMGM